MFGVVPGARYGWPKNILHWKGIQESILDLCATVPIHFVIADGIVAMEGNGPLNGAARPLGPAYNKRAQVEQIIRSWNAVDRWRVIILKVYGV